MYIDARNITQEECLETDICIIGAGAAGISLALELKDSQFKVLLVESGDHKFSHPTQLLLRGENVGQDYLNLEFTRRRQFGGTTNTWAGVCRPLDKIDFEKRAWIPFSGWPFSKSELDPYYERAHLICQLGPYEYSPEYWSKSGARNIIKRDTPLETIVFQYSPPTNFATTYGDLIDQAPNITTLLNANIIELILDAYQQKVTLAKGKTIKGNQFVVKARYFILAAGCLEITRLLLSSHQQHTAGIGNQHDLVGRFFQEHPYVWSGAFMQPIDRLPLVQDSVVDFESDMQNIGTVFGIGLSKSTLIKERISNASALFVKRRWHKVQDSYYSPANISLQKLYDTLRHKSPPEFNQIFENMGVISKNLDSVVDILKNLFIGKFRPSNWVAIRSHIEQVPNPNSRVTLSDQKNLLGQSRVKLDWQFSPQDLKTLNRFHQLLNDGLLKMGFPIQLFDQNPDDWPHSLSVGKHHMGTTRMHDDPKQGVVNSDCQIHGYSNVFVAGSSVFPTSGQSNPTLTIIALAIRLADKIKFLMDEV